MGTNNTHVSVQEFCDNLIDAGVLSANDLRKLLAAPGVKGIPVSTDGTITVAADTSAFSFFETDESSGSDRAFVVTKNWDAGVMTTNAPYKSEGFILFRKGGDGSIYRKASDASAAHNFGVTNMSELNVIQ